MILLLMSSMRFLGKNSSISPKGYSPSLPFICANKKSKYTQKLHGLSLINSIYNKKELIGSNGYETEEPEVNVAVVLYQHCR